MPTVSQSAELYLPRHRLIDTSSPRNFPYPASPSQINVSSHSSHDESHSVIRVLDVDSLIEVPSEFKSRRRCIALGIGLCCLLIVAAVLIPILFIFVINQNQNTSTSSTSSTTTTTTLPTFCNATCYITTRAPLSSYTAVWTFENNLNDTLNIYNGTGVNSPGYSTGYIGQALSLTGTQYVTTPFINFAYSSFTIEAWIKPTALATGGPDYAVFGECDVTGGTQANCMHLLLRNFNPYSLYMGFWGIDLTSIAPLSSSLAGTWFHVAFVFDYSLKQQNIYQSGYNNGQQNVTASPGAYVGTSGLVNIGAWQTNSLFNGLIDQMFVTNRAKTACEILEDATLVAYYSFDSGSVQDSGPNYITGTATSGVTVVSGHVNQAFSFGSSNAYFSFGNLVALGTSNQAFSFSLWIKPTTYTSGGTIIHVANGANGLNNGVFPWCVPFMGFDSANHLIAQVYNSGAYPVVGPILPLNVWTHVVQTYSAANGVILYINGTQAGTTGAAGYGASGVPNYIIVGYYGTLGSTCVPGSVTPGIFYGAVDELRIYSRALSLSDICVLANQ